MRLLIATLLAASLLAAQAPAKAEPAQPEPSTENYEAVIIPVKTLTGDAFDRMVNLLSVFNARIRADAKLRTIVVYASPKVTGQIQKVIADLDRPGSPAAIGRNIEMTISLIECAQAASAESVPTDLENVARQLRANMQCANPQLLETIPMRVREGERAYQALLLSSKTETGVEGRPLTAGVSVQVHAESVGVKDNARFLRINQISFEMSGPVRSNVTGSGDFFESQKTVVGKLSGLSGAIYAVIALKILD